MRWSRISTRPASPADPIFASASSRGAADGSSPTTRRCSKWAQSPSPISPTPAPTSRKAAPGADSRSCRPASVGNTERASGSTIAADIVPCVSRISASRCDHPGSSCPRAARAARSPACSSALRASARTNRSRAPSPAASSEPLQSSPSGAARPSAASTSSSRSASSTGRPARRASSGAGAGSRSAAARPESSATQSAPSAQADSDSSATVSASPLNARSRPGARRWRGPPPPRTARR